MQIQEMVPLQEYSYSLIMLLVRGVLLLSDYSKLSTT